MKSYCMRRYRPSIGTRHICTGGTHCKGDCKPGNMVFATCHAERCLPWLIVDHRTGAEQRFKTIEDARYWAGVEGLKVVT